MAVILKLVGACAPQAEQGPPVLSYQLEHSGVDVFLLRENLYRHCDRHGNRWCGADVYPGPHRTLRPGEHYWLIFEMNLDDVQLILENRYDPSVFNVSFYRVQGRAPETDEEISFVSEEMRRVLSESLLESHS